MYELPQRQVHLDFHTSELIEGIGSKFDKENFQRCLKKANVNSITVFAKCHHGWAYFPSETNEMHPHLNFDLLSAQIDACREIGVHTPIYISAGFDEKYLVEHPDCQVIPRRDAAPKPVASDNGHLYIKDTDGWYHLICMNSPYLDVLLAQTEEVVRKFMPEGIFLDIVGERLCYCERCKAEARRLGMDLEDDETFRKIATLTYKKYYEGIARVAKAIKPDIKIFHNGGHIIAGRRDIAYANTHLELESLPTGGWGYDHFPKSAKYVSNLGMNYLGMTGKFHLSWGEFGGYKHKNALKYEVALSLAHGARCSIGDQMHPYGFLDDATYELIGDAYRMAEAVEEYCYDVTPRADVAFISNEYVSRSNADKSDVGACRILLEGHHLFTMIDCECDFSKYKLIILPDKTEAFTPELEEKLRAFVKGGGKILASGKSGNFATKVCNLGIEMLGENKYNPCYLAPRYDAMGLSPASYVIYAKAYDVALTDENAKVSAYVRETFFNRADNHFCSHKHTPFVPEDAHPGVVYGPDGAYIAWDIFSEYGEVGSYIAKDTVLRVVDELLGEQKTVKTDLYSPGVITLNEQSDKNRLVLHVLFAQTIKRGSGVEVIEDLIPVYNRHFSILCDKDVKTVRLVPQNKEIPFTKSNGRIEFTLDEFSCSQVVTIEY